jgi:hypothetical protein
MLSSRNAVSTVFSLALCLTLTARGALARTPHAGADHEAPVQAIMAAADSAGFDQTVAGVGHVAVNLTNYGFVGTNYYGRAPSFEYPYTTGPGSHVDHLVRGGLWIGGFNTYTGVHRVSTATLDGNYNSRSSTGTEYTPSQFAYIDARGQIAYRAFERLSTLPRSPSYSSRAISEQDIITQFTDAPGKARSGEEDHVPLVSGGIRVRQRSLSWSFEPNDKFVIVEYTITNPFESGEALDSVYVGMYTEMVSVDKSQYELFPPSGSELFAMKDIAYVDSLHLVEEHHYQSANYERDKNGPYSWAGVKFLGGSAQDTLQGAARIVSFHWFTYDPSDTTRNTDSKRFRIMSENVQMDASRVEALDQCERNSGKDPTTCDPVDILAHGPYRLAPGESLTVAFAFVGGEQRTLDDGTTLSAEQDLQRNAQVAQHAYDLGYRISQPPPSPGLRVTPGNGTLTLQWESSPESFRDVSRNDNQQDFEGYRVYISENGRDFQLIREVDVTDSLGFNTGLSSLVDPAPILLDSLTIIDPNTGIATQRIEYSRYRYTITGLKTGFRYWVAVTSYDIGDPANNVGPLESGISFNQNETATVPGPARGQQRGEPMVFPNPYKGAAAWEPTRTGNTPTSSRDKLIWFVNLPERCTIKIYTLAGDLVQTIDFDAATYTGQNARLLTGADGKTREVLSGTMAAWNMISSSEQEIGSGLYMFSVTDRDTGKVSKGHFLVAK